MDIFEARESAVRSYCRIWPAVFDRAAGSWLYDEHGRGYLDFFAGAGALNYGHNNPVLKRRPAGLPRRRRRHPLARHAHGRQTRIPDRLRRADPAPPAAGLPGAVPRPRRRERRRGGAEAGPQGDGPHRGDHVHQRLPRHDARARWRSPAAPSTAAGPGCRWLMPPRFRSATPWTDGQMPDFQWLERLLEDRGSGLDPPAAAIVETVQGEGGINVARRGVAARPGRAVPAARHPAHRRRRPDGLRPHRPVLQLRDRGHHPGHRLPVEVHRRLRAAARAHADPARTWTSGSRASTTAPSAASTPRWSPAPPRCAPTGSDDSAGARHPGQGRADHRGAHRPAESVPGTAPIRSAAGAWPAAWRSSDGELAGKVCTAAFERGLLAETAGPRGEVVKLLPPLTITDAELDQGLELLVRSRPRGLLTAPPQAGW